MNRTMVRRAREVVFTLALAVSLASGLSSCTRSDAVQPPILPSSPPATVVAPTPDSGPPPSSTPSSDPNATGAKSAVVQFWRVIDRLSSDTEAKLEVLTTVARGSAAAQWRQNIKDYRYERLRQIGRVVVLDPVAKPSPKKGRYNVTACIDVGGVNLVDRNGKSVVAANRPTQVKYHYSVERDAAKWYVVEEKATGTC